MATDSTPAAPVDGAAIAARLDDILHRMDRQDGQLSTINRRLESHDLRVARVEKAIGIGADGKELRRHHLVLKRPKCLFGVSSVSYLGHVISATGVAMD
ncbi:hypothetical protein E2562_012277 [Oryza meyeriana var. granulata]|uniref:t-SNARE coiled-coil homology domain-containing protein n=1 Tax=Oryza meyeriana var. granulata TaxID=110450 RepID=A0A6G1DH64_9ORYZ|nr:hypothetical protein E2562_012277 [Oryza meyeriana var. granulata]